MFTKTKQTIEKFHEYKTFDTIKTSLSEDITMTNLYVIRKFNTRHVETLLLIGFKEEKLSFSIFHINHLQFFSRTRKEELNEKKYADISISN